MIYNLFKLPTSFFHTHLKFLLSSHPALDAEPTFCLEHKCSLHQPVFTGLGLNHSKNKNTEVTGHTPEKHTRPLS